jgi:hypothetical protein
VIAPRTAKAAAAGFAALCASTLLSTALVATAQHPVRSARADGGSPTVATAPTSTAPTAPVTHPSPADVTWGG